MKFLANHPQTDKILTSWAGDKELITASFYFWNAGNEMQKSQEGLFRSILYEILRKCPNLIQSVCASKLAAVRGFMGKIEPWTEDELWMATDQLKGQTGSKARFCFFVDGLDEYNGHPDRIISVLERLRTWPDIKLCVSSRPWNEFVDAFGQNPTQKLTLEELTHGDIKIYIEDTLERNTRFEALRIKDARSQYLIEEIVGKARGVFLWVVIVVRSLLNGLRNADRITDLQNRLREFPDTLEKYFSKMIFSVEPIYRQQTAQIFQYALTAEEPLSLMTYSFLDEEELDAAITMKANPLTDDTIEIRKQDMQRRLNGRCKGLLEITSELEAGSFEEQVRQPKVDFLHRTAYDFLLTKDMQQMLTENTNPNFNPQKLLCKAYLAQLIAIKDHYRLARDISSLSVSLLEDLAFYARRLELSLGIPEVPLLDVADNLVKKHPSLFDFVFPSDDFTFLYFLLHRKLYLYVRARLERPSGLNSSTRNALLVCAFNEWPTKYFEPAYDPEMIKILLETGSSADALWDSFLDHIYWRIRRDTSFDNKVVLLIAELLVRRGADPRRRIVTETVTILPTAPTGRISGLFKSRQGTSKKYTMPAADIMRKIFGSAEVDKILMVSPIKRKNFFSRILKRN